MGFLRGIGVTITIIVFLVTPMRQCLSVTGTRAPAIALTATYYPEPEHSAYSPLRLASPCSPPTRPYREALDR